MFSRGCFVSALANLEGADDGGKHLCCIFCQFVHRFFFFVADPAISVNIHFTVGVIKTFQQIFFSFFSFFYLLSRLVRGFSDYQRTVRVCLIRRLNVLTVLSNQRLDRSALPPILASFWLDASRRIQSERMTLTIVPPPPTALPWLSHQRFFAPQRCWSPRNASDWKF